MSSAYIIVGENTNNGGDHTFLIFFGGSVLINVGENNNIGGEHWQSPLLERIFAFVGVFTNKEIGSAAETKSLGNGTI